MNFHKLFEGKSEFVMKSGSQSKIALEIVDGTKLVSKISKDVDYVIELEGDILTKLNQLNCPNVCELIHREPGKLLLEFIDGESLGEYCHKPDCIISLINRGLVAAAIFNEEFDVVHNDLHGENVLVRSIERDYVAYIFADGQELVYETFGVEPVVIDFGLAFPGKCSDKMRMTTAFTELGLFPFETDRLADARRLVKEMERYSGKRSLEFSKIRAKSFGKLVSKLQHDSGWFRPYFENLSSKISEALTATEIPIDVLDPSARIVDLFCAQLKIPLELPDDSTDPSLAYERFFEAYWKTGIKKTEPSISFIKDSFDLDDEMFRKKYNNYPPIALDDVKRTGKELVAAVQKITFDIAMSMSKRKAQLNALSPCSSVREVVSRLTTPVSFRGGTRLGIYSVKNRKNYEVKITHELADELNSEIIAISNLIE